MAQVEREAAAGACDALATRLAPQSGSESAALAIAGEQACDVRVLRACADRPCRDGWLEACIRWPSEECRDAVASGRAPAVLAALTRVDEGEDNDAAHVADELACALRPSGGARLFEREQTPRCVAARIDTGGAPPPTIVEEAVATIPYLRSDASFDRFAATLRVADADHAPGRDDLYDLLCVTHRADTTALRDACAALGPNAEAGWQEEASHTAQRQDMELARSSSSDARTAYGALFVLPLYAFAAWILRRRAGGALLAYAGLVLAGALASASVTGNSPPGTGGAVTTGLVVVPLCALLGLVAFVRRARIVVAAVATAVAAVSLALLARDDAAQAALHMERSRMPRWSAPERSTPAAPRPIPWLR